MKSVKAILPAKLGIKEEPGKSVSMAAVLLAAMLASMASAMLAIPAGAARFGMGPLYGCYDAFCFDCGRCGLFASMVYPTAVLCAVKPFACFP